MHMRGEELIGTQPEACCLREQTVDASHGPSARKGDEAHGHRGRNCHDCRQGVIYGCVGVLSRNRFERTRVLSKDKDVVTPSSQVMKAQCTARQLPRSPRRARAPTAGCYLNAAALLAHLLLTHALLPPEGGHEDSISLPPNPRANPLTSQALLLKRQAIPPDSPLAGA